MRLIVILGLVAACHRGAEQGASCGTAASNFLVLAKADLALARPDDATQRAVVDQLPAMRDALAAACTDGAWSAPVRDCLAAATDHAQFAACEQQLTVAQRAALASTGSGE